MSTSHSTFLGCHKMSFQCFFLKIEYFYFTFTTEHRTKSCRRAKIITWHVSLMKTIFHLDLAFSDYLRSWRSEPISSLKFFHWPNLCIRIILIYRYWLLRKHIKSRILKVISRILQPQCNDLLHKLFIYKEIMRVAVKSVVMRCDL